MNEVIVAIRAAIEAVESAYHQQYGPMARARSVQLTRAHVQCKAALYEAQAELAAQAWRDRRSSSTDCIFDAETGTFIPLHLEDRVQSN